MVDFNSGETIGRPAVDVVKISILQRRYDFIEAYEDFKKKRLAGAAAPLSIVRARLISFFLEIQACLKRRYKSDDFKEVHKDVFNSEDEDKILDLFYNFNEELDNINLTRIDTEKVYNKLRVEEENKMKGY